MAKQKETDANPERAKEPPLKLHGGIPYDLAFKVIEEGGSCLSFRRKSPLLAQSPFALERRGRGRERRRRSKLRRMLSVDALEVKGYLTSES
jgi:hypothetical protein